MESRAERMEKRNHGWTLMDADLMITWIKSPQETHNPSIVSENLPLIRVNPRPSVVLSP
jgi:hypothetical protein